MAPKKGKQKRSKTEKKILDEIDVEFSELEEEFGDLGLDDDDETKSLFARLKAFFLNKNANSPRKTTRD